MDPQFQSELTAAILTLTPGMILLALVALVGLLMLLEKVGILASFSGTAKPAAAAPVAAAEAAKVETTEPSPTPPDTKSP